MYYKIVPPSLQEEKDREEEREEDKEKEMVDERRMREEWYL